MRANGNNAPWLLDRLERGRVLWEAGEPARAIAAELGVTRNAVIGMASRLGWGKRRPAAPRGRPRRLREMESAMERLAQKTRVRASQGRAEAIPAPAKLRTIAAVAAETPASGPRPLLQLSVGECRWPLSGAGAAMLFCGEPVKEMGVPWCAEHHRRCYQRTARL